ncbi:methylcobamide:CoM methyltransferase MtbA [Slackia heliotrinireducens]|uniref:Methyltransferase, MtaA/CmuA family n=1 Tax=Slackia heliotrinireducens (strain ATCC 29202 / DSM 20476 / NCTC 11029 / RHS 1) TaxID=471855 RepID=C7N394_SLAHD|nr:methylcobamide:CoM methyltransferase MtbA [Slackia heliotrinireducens]ACV23617.1 methyltransferase, MtaA/CmuA family [Slackia heliotrinireducens DSM 20476]VEH03101.1 Uroporphyrinogen decarboxylase [Slackia heliotrinireducens]
MTTAKERLLATLDGKETDRPPCICPGGMMNMVTVGLQDEIGVFFPEAHYDPEKMAALAKAVYDRGFFENYGVPFCMSVESEAMGAEVTIGRKDVEPHITGYAIFDVHDYKQVKPMDLESGRAKTVIEAIKILKTYDDGVPIVGNLVGPVSVASSVMDPVKYYKQLYKEKELSHAYMDFITNELIRFGLAQVEAGADVIAIADPSGTGEIMGPRSFDQYAVTYLEKLQKALQDAGARTIVHICGQMRSVYEQVAKISCNALSFDAVVPIKEARKNLPGRVVMGNVSTFAIELKDAERVRSLTRMCMNNGSNIIAPACGLGMGSPSENVRAVLETVREAGEAS